MSRPATPARIPLHPLQELGRRALAQAGGTFDVAVVRTVMELSRRSGRGRSTSRTVESRLAQLDAVAERWSKLDEEAIFPAPSPITEVRERHVRDLVRKGQHAASPTGVVTDVKWKSGFHPIALDNPQRYLAVQENTFGHARLFTHATHGRTTGSPRPTMICIHGYRAGNFALEEHAWAMEWFYGLGLDVALFQLPFHSLRAAKGASKAPSFPGPDVAKTNEGFAQAIWDLRGLMAWIRARTGGPVGVAGMSLGGYTTSLVATVARDLDFAVPFIPLSDFTDVVVEHEALRGVAVPQSLIDAGKRAMARVSPLARTPTIPSDKVLVIGAKGDGITKLAHAEQLARHFGAPLFTFPGGHLLQFGRREAFAEMARFLARRGIIAGRR
ncbi:MAG: alpha/beta hydrolase [Polyangiales bacterium]